MHHKRQSIKQVFAHDRIRVDDDNMTLSCKPMHKKGRAGITTSGILQKWTFSALSAFSEERQGEFPTERMLSFQFFARRIGLHVLYDIWNLKAYAAA